MMYSYLMLQCKEKTDDCIVSAGPTSTQQQSPFTHTTTATEAAEASCSCFRALGCMLAKVSQMEARPSIET